MTAAVKLDWAAMLPQPEATAITADAGDTDGATALPVAEAPAQPHSEALSAAKVSSDDRVWCSDCQRLAGGKRCKAPAVGLLIASMNYEPVQTWPRRCFAYLPGPNDPDQTPGATRWPWLKETA